MGYDIFKCFGLDKVHDALTEEESDRKDTGNWEFVSQKTVLDSDGFVTEYTWYTDGSKHIFMFGDEDLYAPDEDYADYVADSESEAREWFDSYNGFEDSDMFDDMEDDFDVEKTTGNSNFMNEGFERVFGQGMILED